MSQPRFNVTILAIVLGSATVVAGCSSNPKKNVVDTGPKSSDQIYYQAAEKALNHQQYTEASKALEAIDSYYPTGRYAQQAQLELMYVKFQQKDFESAVAAADRFIRLNPQHPNVDYAYYVKGVSNMELNYDSLLRYTSLQQAHRDINYLKQAYQNFVDLIRRFPSSQYSVDAAQRMNFIGHELAESEMNVARFNIKRKAWVAAVERSQWVIEHYPQTPQVAEALATAAYSYQQLGDNATAQQYLDVIKLNYPKLIKANGSVNLEATRQQRSWFNRATLGVLGRSAKAKETSSNDNNAPEIERSWVNRISFGTLDKPEVTEIAVPTAPNPSNVNLDATTIPDSHVNAPAKRSWLNRLSFGLIDQTETDLTLPSNTPANVNPETNSSPSSTP